MYIIVNKRDASATELATLANAVDTGNSSLFYQNTNNCFCNTMCMCIESAVLHYNILCFL